MYMEATEGNTAMSDETYNGWINRDTWLVPLWVDNEYLLYQARVALLAEQTEVTAELAERVALIDLGLADVITDDIDWSKVDWAEIAEHWEIDRKELEERS